MTVHENSKCEHKRRVFMNLEQINRPKDKDNLKTLKGTQKLHCVTGSVPGCVKSRHSSCFCKECLEGNEDKWGKKVSGIKRKEE